MNVDTHINNATSMTVSFTKRGKSIASIFTIKNVVGTTTEKEVAINVRGQYGVSFPALRATATVFEM
jgi:hypothetical protein